MTTENNLEAAFANIMDDLEKAELQLVARQTELSTELQAVERELDRITRVRQAMFGKPPEPARKNARPRKATKEAVLRVIVDKPGITQAEIAEALGVDGRGPSSALGALVRGEQVRTEGENGDKRYFPPGRG